MDMGIHERPFAEVLRPGKIVREILFGNVYRLVLFGGKRVSDEGYYVNGFFQSP